MFVYGLFNVTNYLELTLAVLNKSGFNNEQISVIKLSDCKPPKANLLDTIHQTDNISLMDGISLTATVGMIFGVIYGSVLPLGPVAFGLIGMFAGAGTGYALDRIKHRNIDRGQKSYKNFVILAVVCSSEEEVLRAEKIMAEHQSAAIGRGSDFQLAPNN
ncbi:MAG: hypothetical protein ACOY46_10500 [Bacillota bacterium]